jgi:hypothetical protein
MYIYCRCSLLFYKTQHIPCFSNLKHGGADIMFCIGLRQEKKEKDTKELKWKKVKKQYKIYTHSLIHR